MRCSLTPARSIVWGKVTDGTSNFDFEPEETKRQITIGASLFNAEWKKKKINILDTPGDPNFSAEVSAALLAADIAVLAVDAVDSVKPLTEKVWSAFGNAVARICSSSPRWTGKRADFDKVIEDVKKALDIKPLVLQIPIGKEADFSGVVDLLSMKAVTFDGDGRDVVRADVPDDLKDEAESKREVLIEDLAEVDDALMERYLEGEELGPDELALALNTGYPQQNISCRWLICSASMNKGVPAPA